MEEENKVHITIGKRKHLDFTTEEALKFLKTRNLRNSKVLLSTPCSKLQQVFISPGRRLSAPIPRAAYNYAKEILPDELQKVPEADIKRMLRYGRSGVIFGCRLSLRPDIYGRVNSVIHTRFSEPEVPVDLQELCEKGHLGRTIRFPDPVTGLETDCFVSYDSELHVPVTLPCYRMYFPNTLDGRKISYRQRDSLAKGRRITLSNGTFAQVDALSASVVFTRP